MNWFNRLTQHSTRLVERLLPDPFVLVLLLTLLMFGLGVLKDGQNLSSMLMHWGSGFWQLLEFSMQMVLVLVTGFVLAHTDLFKKIVQKVASLIHNPGNAILVISLVSLTASWLNWGFGLVIGALFAKEIAKRIPDINYALLVASAYSGFIVWHGGLSGSVPLVIATEGHFNQELIGLISTSDTIFSRFNLLILLALFITIPILNRLMMGEKTSPVKIKLQEPLETATTYSIDRPADHLEHSRFLSLSIGLMGLGFLGLLFYNSRSGLNLNSLNFAFLFLGLLLHKTPRRFLNSLNEAVKGSSGIIIQFPFYAGIMGMMLGSGIAKDISLWFVEISTATTLPLFSFLSAGLVNIFVPSGGGQWALQSTVILPAAIELKADIARVSMAVAWGDAWTNLIQPFWALPVLALAGLKAKDIMGYCLITLFASGAVIGLGLLIF